MIEIDKTAWEDFVATRSEANFLHAWQWGELHASLGQTVVRRGIYVNHSLVGVWQGVVKDARRGRYLEVPGGPLLDWSDKLSRSKALKGLREVAAQHRCVFVRIRPQLVDNPEHREYLQSIGLRQAPFHLHAEHTNILDLTPSEEDLLTKMRRQTRYEVRRADKQGIETTVLSGAPAIEQFYEVQRDTALRQGFVPSSRQFLLALSQAFGEDLRVYRATKGGVLLNMALVIWHGQEADYYEAASTPDSRKYAGAYGLQWQAIRDAKAAGKTRYNFWGIAYSDDPKHRYAGVTTFKRGFGGDDVTYVPAHDLVLKKVRYIKNWVIETARRKKRKL